MCSRPTTTGASSGCRSASSTRSGSAGRSTGRTRGDPGELDPPVFGCFDGDVGVFEGEDVYQGPPDPRPLHLVAGDDATPALGAGVLRRRRQDLGDELGDGLHTGRGWERMTVLVERNGSGVGRLVRARLEDRDARAGASRSGTPLLKWYDDRASGGAGAADQVGDLARLGLADAARLGELRLGGALGFVILHRCGEAFYFLLVSTWQNDNELWETVWAKDGDADPEFHPWPLEGGTHRPTFCVWELGAVAHERHGVEPVPRLRARTARRGSATSETRSRDRRVDAQDRALPGRRLACCNTSGHEHERPDTEPVETQEWLDSVDAVVDADGRGACPTSSTASSTTPRTSTSRRRAGVSTPYVNTDPHRGRAGDAGRPGARGGRDRARPLERDRDRPPGERRVDRARRPHRELPVRRDALRGRLRPLLAGALRGPSRRPRLPPGPLVARASTRARSSKGGCPRTSCAASGRRSAAAGSRRIRTRG